MPATIAHSSPQPYTTWRGVNFGANAGLATTSDFLSSPDKARLLNIWEYFHDSDPNAAGSSPLQAQIVAAHSTLTFPRNIAASDVTVTIQGADSLAGPWTDLARSTGAAPFAALVAGPSVSETGSGATRTVEMQDLYLVTDSAHPTRYFRLSIQAQ